MSPTLTTLGTALSLTLGKQYITFQYIDCNDSTGMYSECRDTMCNRTPRSDTYAHSHTGFCSLQGRSIGPLKYCQTPLCGPSAARATLRRYHGILLLRNATRQYQVSSFSCCFYQQTFDPPPWGRYIAAVSIRCPVTRSLCRSQWREICVTHTSYIR